MSEDLIEQLRQSARFKIGRVVAEFRGRLGQILTQEKLGEEFRLPRTAIAHFEEGREFPTPDLLTAICEKLKIPDKLWLAGTHVFYLDGFVFHELVCELVGRRISMSDHTASDQLVALDRTQRLFRDKLNDAQAYSELNSLLVFYGERPITRSFFDRYLRGDAFASNVAFLARLRQFQAEAMRLYGNFRRAFTRMSRVTDLVEELLPLQSKPLDRYTERGKFTSIKVIPSSRLPDLGYIAVQKIQQQNRERSELHESLLRLADDLERSGLSALQSMAESKLRKMRTLLRKVESSVQLEVGLFADVDAEVLRAEAARIAPEQRDLVRIAETQRIGLHNLGVYLSEAFMDVYVATSMREDADFHSVNSFIQTLFSDRKLDKLNLRYFNPTQSWIEDRVAKGLVEALMLRRAAVTIYMAQKSDTFGKDSEASVALGQGKTVIVYVPRLFDEETGINSERLFRVDSSRLTEQLQQLGLQSEVDDLDAREKAKYILRSQLLRLTPEQFKRVLAQHWADFDLHGEASAISHAHLKAEAVLLVKRVAEGEPEDPLVLVPDTLRKELTDRLVNIAERFESRAKTFRDIHPLALQVIVRSGVLNGILVTRSVEDCARLMREVIENTVATDVEVDDHNYRLVERQTRSTLRVVSRHRLLTFAFWSQYFEESVTATSTSDLPAVPL